MATRWKTVTFGDVVRLEQGLCFNKKTNHLMAETGMPLLRIGDLKNGTETKFVNAERVPPKYIACPKDIIYSRTGQVGLVFKGRTGVVHNNCFRVIPQENIEPDYVYWYLRQPTTIEKARALAGGAAQPDLNHGAFKSIEFTFPDQKMQRRIVGILSAYDELIENSQRRIQNLEKMARALYREWFVLFKFPGHEKVKIIEGVPEGWEVKQLSQLCLVMKSGSTPKRKVAEYWNGGEISWFKTGELWDGFLFESKEKVTEQANALIFDPGTILMAIYGSPTVGRLGIVTRPSSCNQAALGLVADPKQISQAFLYFVLFSLRDHFNSMAQGAAQQNISKEKVAGTSALVPPLFLVTAFDRVAEPIFAQLRTLQCQTQNLRKTRDLLLPRLLSGQIDLGEN